MSTPMTTARSDEALASRRFSESISFAHASHHVAQRLTNATRPSDLWPTEVRPPDKVATSTSGNCVGAEDDGAAGGEDAQEPTSAASTDARKLRPFRSGSLKPMTRCPSEGRWFGSSALPRARSGGL